MKSPYDIIKERYVTEKSGVLGALKDAQSSKTLKRCEKPKYVFLVDKKANKKEIAWAVESIYKDKDIKVKQVNTINVKPKVKTVRGNKGITNSFKKAVVTLDVNDNIDEQV